jgi:hypothetical protein
VTSPDTSPISPDPRAAADAADAHDDVDLSGIRGYLFDLDGVLTPTAVVHMHAWSRLFTPFLEARGAEPYTDADYFAHIDGKPRYDGVRSLLQSRGIVVDEGEVTDAPAVDTVHGLGNRKNDAFNETLAEEGVTAYPASVAFLDAVARAGARVARQPVSPTGSRSSSTARLPPATAYPANPSPTRSSAPLSSSACRPRHAPSWRTRNRA